MSILPPNTVFISIRGKGEQEHRTLADNLEDAGISAFFARNAGQSGIIIHRDDWEETRSFAKNGELQVEEHHS